MSKTYKKDASFNNSEKLQESFAEIFLRERAERMKAASDAVPVARENVMIASKARARQEDDSDRKDDLLSDDDELGGAENDPELAAIKMRRFAELQKAFAQAQSNKHLGHGEYMEITQDEFLPTVTRSQYAVIHFFHRDFTRCKIVDKHLSALAQVHADTKFAKADVEKLPFFVQKLGVRMLPCVLLFIDGLAVDRVVGFDDFGGKDDFSTRVFEQRLWRAGILSDGSGQRVTPKAAPMKTLLDA